MKENSSCRTGSSFHQNGVKEASGSLAIGTIHPRTRRRSRAAVFFFLFCTMISSEPALGVSFVPGCLVVLRGAHDGSLGDCFLRPGLACR